MMFIETNGPVYSTNKGFIKRTEEAKLLSEKIINGDYFSIYKGRGTGKTSLLW